MSTLFAVIEESDPGLDGTTTQLFDDKGVAIGSAERHNRDAESAGVPIIFRVFALTEVAADRPSSTDGYIRDGDDSCPDCTCCTRLGCYRGPDSDCPANSDGMYLCPCTETS
jgi:hypothetical protein